MNRDIYSNIEFTRLKERLNQEIKRRGTFRWFDPLTSPSVGEDKSSPLSIPDIGDRILVDDKTYSINNPSEGSLEPTRNINYPAHGENPGGHNPDNNITIPNTSAGQVNVDELKNLLIGLAKMNDINLFYGRDEVKYTAFRDPKGIEDALVAAENSILNKPLAESDCLPTKNDPNGGIQNYQHDNFPNETYSVTYPMDENGNYVMSSGEYDGEEIKEFEGLGPTNFYDDYGARPGDANYHPHNPYVSEIVDRDWHDQDNNRNDVVTRVRPGGISSKRFGLNPRNPQQGNEYNARPVYGGVITNCNNACTGLCYVSCDNQCSESCSSTCWSRCGNACTSTCGNVCTGCSTMCFSSCKTKCENNTGYSCLKAGARAVKVVSTGGKNGEPAQNKLEITIHTCTGCSYSCQFYPNKKTECWDSGCMGKCFTSCTTSCSTSCYGGCIDNTAEPGDSYKTGKGRGCDGGCTLNCVGLCQGVCEGYCVQTCWHACKQKCSDNCSWKCTTSCGSGCTNGCKQTCTGCTEKCSGSCKGQTESVNCSGCSMEVGCTANCQSDCNSNCVGWGCKSVCGTEAGNSCEANCRMNCSGTSCTAMCSDACSEQCTTCVNNCGWQCGACSSSCSSGCSQECNVTCSAACEHSCETNCVMSCSENCGACFRAGTLIETINGPVPIEEIKVGDMVLTQSGEYHKVYKNFKRTCNDNLIAINAIGTPTIYTTKDHPFWIKKYIGIGKEDGKLKQLYSIPEWVEAGNIKARDKLCLYTPPIGNIEINPGIAYMVGRWLGDGWRSDEVSHNGKQYARFSICCGKHEEDDFDLKLSQCNIKYTKCEKDTAFDYRIPSKWNDSTKDDRIIYNNEKLISILRKCGKYSYGKYIPQEIFNWNEEALCYLIQGYIDADGYMINNDLRKFKLTTVSKKLAYGISMILRMLERNPGWYEKKYSDNEGYIMGRKINLRTVHVLGSQLNEYSKYFSFLDIENKCTWTTIRKPIIPSEIYDVYNLSVEDDPTYYADGVLVHNCSDLCYSCVGMCIGVCSVKCENGCSSCTNNCGWWCDSSCNQACFSTCDNMCIQTCMGSCVSFLESKTTTTSGPERDPISTGYIYPNPANRWEERESFKLVRDIPRSIDKPEDISKSSLIFITVDDDRNLSITCPEELKYVVKQTVINGGVFTYDENDGSIIIDEDMLPAIVDVNKPNIDNGGGLYIIIFEYNENIQFTDDDVNSKLPFGFELHSIIKDSNNNSIILVQKDEFLHAEEGV